MSRVIGVTKVHVDEIMNAIASNGAIDGAGIFSLTTRGGAHINIGNIIRKGITGPQGSQGATGTTGPAGPGWAGPTAFTPSFTNGGSATFSTATGSYYTMGDLVFFSCIMVGNVAGSGATICGFNGPLPVHRGERQIILGNGDGNATTNGPIQLVAFTSGAGNLWDRLRDRTGIGITGSLLTSGVIYTFTGVYRKA
jgi:hypothetical protein